jgi:signal transduction histidine kinase
MSLFQTTTNPSTLPINYLGYSLLILLVCITALIKVYQRWQVGKYPQGIRMLQALIIISVLRLATFLSIFFLWSIEPGFSPSLLVLDQAIALISMLIIFWLWNFPEPSREIDPVLGVLLTAIAILVVLQMVFVPSLLEGFTGTISFWQVLSIITLVVTGVLIFIRKPNLWINGIVMSVLLLVGALLTLITEDLNPMYLAQLAAYPLLISLSDRFPVGETQPDESTTEDDSRRRVSVEYDNLKLIQKLFDENDPTGVLYKIAQTTAYLILSDLALVIDTPDEHGKMRIIAGYDLIREEPLQALTLDSRSIPLLTNYIQRGKLLHIPASSTSRDLSHLSKMLQLSKPGHLLAAPVLIPGANKTIGVVLFSPFSNRPWTKDDQNYITLLCKLYEAAFSHHLISQDGESEDIKNTIRDLTTQLTRLTKDKQSLKEEMAVLAKDHQNLLLESDILQANYDGVLSWGNSLERHLAMLVDLSKKESTEALRKYIDVIKREVQEAKEDKEKIEVDLEIAAESKPDELDPDSTKPANLQEAIQSCLDQSKAEIDEKEITTSLDLPDDTPLLKMNHALFREIFSFLLANAIEENSPGGEIKIRTQIYEEDHVQHFAHINITDQGDGYFHDEIAAVMNDYLTTEQQEKLTQVMTNLYVTKNLVENEGGRMWVESKPGEGTTVSLLLAFLH